MPPIPSYRALSTSLVVLNDGLSALAAMDPLSVSASIAGLLTLAAATAKGVSELRSLRDAPGDVALLQTEISDLQGVLEKLRTCLGPDDQVTVEPHLEATKKCLEDIRSTIESRVLVRGGGADVDKRVSKRRWHLEKERMTALRKRLRELKLNISTAVGVSTKIDLARVEVRVINLQDVVEDIRQNQTELTAAISHPLSSVATTTRGGHTTHLHPGVVSFRARTYRGSQCRLGCLCACHARTQANTPRLARHILGMLFVGYSGVPVLRPACTEFSCRGSSSSSIDVSYHFPSWMVAAVISASLHFLPLQGPQVALRTRRVVSYEARIFEYARRGDVSGLQYLFSKGLASPNDLSSVGGSTALHYAVRNENASVARFLLTAGADPYQENDAQKSAYDSAWNVILCSPAAERHQLEDIFTDDEPLEKRSFSRLHSVVLGLSPIKSVALVLEESSALVNATDLHGRTALSWSAERGDAAAVEALLGHGADVDKACHRGKTPLVCALRAPDPECLRVLVRAGADVNRRGGLGNTPLHLAALDLNDGRYITPLVEGGALLEAVNAHGFTPLMIAAWRDHDEVARVLMAQGADVEGSCRKGRSALLCALTTGAGRVARLLLDAGADVGAKSMRGETVLHTVARADVVGDDVLAALRDADLGAVDADALDKDGCTAEAYFERRTDVGEEKRGLFTELVAIARRSRPSPAKREHEPRSGDACRCFCSTDGCTSTTMWLKTLCTEATPTERIDLILQHARARQPGPAASTIGGLLAEACRFEIFTRLGMAHTCCRRVGCRSIIPGRGHEDKGDDVEMDAERAELREEDRFFRQTLDAYVAAYESLYKQLTGSGDPERFWTSWWAAVDESLSEDGSTEGILSTDHGPKAARAAAVSGDSRTVPDPLDHEVLRARIIRALEGMETPETSTKSAISVSH